MSLHLWNAKRLRIVMQITVLFVFTKIDNPNKDSQPFVGVFFVPYNKNRVEEFIGVKTFLSHFKAKKKKRWANVFRRF